MIMGMMGSGTKTTCVIFLILVLLLTGVITWFLHNVRVKKEGRRRSPGSIVRVDEKMYQVDEELGSGCCGVVYRVHHHSPIPSSSIDVPSDPLALKVIHNPGIHDCESKILQRVPKHPNIISIHQLGHTKWGEPCIVMEHVPMSIHSLHRSKLDAHLMRSVMNQLMSALSLLHENEIIHRDIKPENILYKEGEGCPIFTDFGHSRFSQDGTLKHGSSYTRGTHIYFAPEGLRRESIQGRPLDIWSMGCVFARMIFGRSIFKEDSEKDVEHIIEQQTRFVKERRWEQWKEWKERFPKSHVSAMSLLESMIQLDPTNRPSAATCLEHDWFHTVEFP